MGLDMHFTSKEVALIVCLAALYAVLGFILISPIIGLPGKAITAAAVIAPIMGFVLGAYKSSLPAALGGLIGLMLGSISLPSYASGITAALISGMLYAGRQRHSAFVYISLLLVLGFFPMVGPIWLYPAAMWFQIAGLLILVSPLTSHAIGNFNTRNSSRLLLAFFILSLVSTLAGQIAGSIILMVQIQDAIFWNSTWRFLTFIYPLERMIIALAAASLGGLLYKALGPTDVTKQSRSDLPQALSARFGAETVHENTFICRHDHANRAANAIVEIQGSISDKHKRDSLSRFSHHQVCCRS